MIRHELKNGEFYLIKHTNNVSPDGNLTNLDYEFVEYIDKLKTFFGINGYLDLDKCIKDGDEWVKIDMQKMFSILSRYNL